MSKGTIDKAAIYPREIAREALKYNASSVLLSHNHPSKSSSLRPSGEDIHTTKLLKDSLKLFGIQIADHIIVNDNTYYSFAENGLI